MSKRWGSWRARLRHLVEDQRGAVMMIVGLAIIPLFAVIGLAIDAGRGYMLKSQLSYAIDAAGLAGGRAFESDLRQQDIMMYFDANFPPGYMGAQLAPGNPVITFDDANNKITITATATVPTYFMRVAGIPDMTVSARTVIQRELKGIELVLVMDNTGSMRGNGGMAAMKPAATQLINILYGEREEVENLWVGLVPYVASVDIGSQHTDWLTGYDSTAYLPTTWKGCVEARAFPNDSNDETPDVAPFTPYRWATTLNQYLNPYYQSGYSYDQTKPKTWGHYLTGDNEWNPAGPLSALKLDNDLYQNEGTGPNLGCGPAITPLIASKTTILNAIAAMAPWHRGGTMANLGLAWGWRVLSPRWRGLWDGDDPDTLPLDYHTANMHKVVILLTDGNNEWYDYPGITTGSSPNTKYNGIPGDNSYPTISGTNYATTFKNTWPGADYTAYGRLGEGRLGTTDKATAKTTVDNRMLNMCQAMKDQDIMIYTMTFGPSPDAATQSLYTNCATKPDMYFNAPSGSALQAAFEQIADQLSSLRIAE